MKFSTHEEQMTLPSLQRKKHFTLIVPLHPPVSESSWKQKWNMCKLTHFNSTNSGLALSKHTLLVYKEKKVWHCINSLQCFAHWGWTGAEGMDGCPGPTAAWHGGTENPSVWGTLHLLCAAHSPIDMSLRFVLSTKTIQVSPDCCSRLPTQYLTATPNANTKRAEVIIEALTFSFEGVMKDQADLWELRLISLKIIWN